MLKIKNEIDFKELEKFGFKKCKKPYDMLYYKCLSSGIKAIFIGANIYICDWEENDPRIHKTPNCKWKSNETYDDVLYDLIIAGLVEKEGV